MKNSRTIAASVAGLATLGALVACAPTTDTGETSLTIGVPSVAINFDPYSLPGGMLQGNLIHDAVYDGLLAWDEEADTEMPWIAKEFEISSDGLTMSMTLRDDVDY